MSKVDEYEMTLDDLPNCWVEAICEINFEEKEKEEKEEDEEEDDDDVDTTIFPWQMGWDEYVAFLEEIVKESRRNKKTAQ